MWQPTSFYSINFLYFCSYFLIANAVLQNKCYFTALLPSLPYWNKVVQWWNWKYPPINFKHLNSFNLIQLIVCGFVLWCSIQTLAETRKDAGISNNLCWMMTNSRKNKEFPSFPDLCCDESCLFSTQCCLGPRTKPVVIHHPFPLSSSRPFSDTRWLIPPHCL